jgi:DNA-binding CsgD family transcriptional regulator
MVSREQTDFEIANALNLSVEKVEALRLSIMEKLITRIQ